MSVDKAKEFLVDVSENEDAADQIEQAYLSALVEVSSQLGYDLTSEDLSVAIEDMSGLGEDADDVEGFFTIRDSVFFGASATFATPRVVFDPFRLFGGRPRPRFGR